MGSFYGYMFGSGNGSAVAYDGGGKEESFAEHDRHYHPNGYKDGDKCNKRERLEKEDSVSPTDAPEITMEEIRKRLKDEYGVTLCDFDEANEVVAEHGSEGFKKGWEMAERPTDAEFKETAGRVLRVLDDLNERFQYKPPLDYLFCVKFKEMERDGKRIGIGGLSEEDHIGTDVSKMAIAVNPPEWSGVSYGNKDFKKHKEVVIRHEIGHVIATKEILNELTQAYNLVLSFCRRKGMNKGNVIDYLISQSSEYAVSSGVIEEFLSEIFSRYVDEENDVRHLHFLFAGILDGILKGDF